MKILIETTAQVRVIKADIKDAYNIYEENGEKMSEFYVYAYLRTDGSPYYIGKGKEKRAYSNNSRITPKPKDNSRIQILEYFTDESKAFTKEKELIAQYGRKDQGTGILWNLSDGGEGNANPSEETRRKLRESHLGKKPSEETRRRLKESRLGKKHSEETKKKMSISQRNRSPISEETREKIRVASKKREESKRNK